MKKRILIVFGTRPEAIKMSPLVKELQNNSEFFDVTVCVTGQHREMLHQVLSLFEIKVDFDLNIMKPGQDLYDVTISVLTGMKTVLEKVKPDVVLVHGDTTTSSITALAAFYQRIQVGHVEAGLRTHNIYSPFPEEMNRLLTARLANFHFAPTAISKHNLMNEGVVESNIHVTGNTVIDALSMVVEKIKIDNELNFKLISQIRGSGYNINQPDNNNRIVLITGHRRENFGEGFINICKAIKTLTETYENVDFVYPMHLNPNVRNPIQSIFGNNKKSNMFFIEPLEYFSFIYLLAQSHIILTDSGGIQEEAPGLGKPVLVMRETTERPEALDAGTVKLVGTSYDRIVYEVSRLLDDDLYWSDMSKSINPYGDGKACGRIIDVLKKL